MKIEGLLNEASKEITGLHTIVVKDGNTSRRFTFQSHRIDSLKKELAKRYGSKIVTKIASQLKKAETNGKLKFFTKDDAVDFEITGDKVKPNFKVVDAMKEGRKGDGDGDALIEVRKGDGDGDALVEGRKGDGDGDSLIEVADGGPEGKQEKVNKNKSVEAFQYDDEVKPKYSADTDKTKVMTKCSKTGKNKVVKTFDNVKSAKNFIKREKLNDKKYFLEANIEIKDKNAQVITVDGKPYLKGYGSLKADYPKHFAALRAKLKKDGKTMGNLGGNDPAVDIVAKADGTIQVNYDA